MVNWKPVTTLLRMALHRLPSVYEVVSNPTHSLATLVDVLVVFGCGAESNRQPLAVVSKSSKMLHILRSSGYDTKGSNKKRELVWFKI